VKNLKDLPNDVYNLFDPESDHEVNEELLDEFAENLKEILRLRLRASSRREGDSIRFSALGKPNRKVWMDAHPDPERTESLLPKTYLKFLYGDVIEQLYLYLAKEAGHEVTNEQMEVEIDGVKGHIDAIIDGTVVDLKSASSFGYKKFEQGTVEQDDPFGYVAQLAGYANVLTPGKEAAWWAVDKSSGDNCISPLSPMVIKYHKPEDRIAELKEVVDSDEMPPPCYDPVPDGKSGNMKLATGCSYCEHKFRCFPDARLFLYSNGPRYLTTVVKEPNVPEVK
jgi:hypothetical protein